jgi:uncharacterized protein (DUF2062 family)
MTTAAATAASPHPARTGTSFFRRLLQPLAELLTQGLTPSRLAATFAVGTVCSLFPFLGATSLLNLVVGLALRMNQPALQTLNQLLGPVQLALILVYVRLGEWVWRAESAHFTVGAMVDSFRSLSLGQFLVQFGQAGVHAFSAWLVTAPLLFALIYLPAMLVARCFTRRSNGAAHTS